MLESINLSAIVSNHLKGFISPQTKKLRWGDLVLHFGLPAAIGVVWSIWGPPTDALGNVVQGLAVLTGLYFGLLVYVFQLRLGIAESVTYQRSTRLIPLIDALFHNTVYATLAGGIATVAVVVTDLLGEREGWAVGLVLALCVHLVLTAAMILMRAGAAYGELVNDKRRAAAGR